MLRFDVYDTAQLLHYHLGNRETKSHPSPVNIFGFSYLTKKVEQSMHVLLFYTDASILNLCQKDALFQFDAYLYIACIREFNSVSNQIEENLFKALLVV